ncbi:hypothetical protein [Symbioplanes lichenis]|uniref:hypothetical protein n=1 Tax=Symbioplanes lichenis TaxID=1629072 RepID=UPI002739FAD4|nr:hypothetical protein [Actinoplanes lichenis]
MGAQQTWSIAASIAAVIGAVVVVCAALLTIRQLREMTKARHLAAMLQIYELIGSPDARAARRRIYRELKSEPSEVTNREREAIDDVAIILDRVGLLVKAELVPAEIRPPRRGLYRQERFIDDAARSELGLIAQPRRF